MKKEPGEPLSFPCDHCDEVFKLKSKLTQHLKFSHDGIGKKFHCDLCDTKYESSSKLKMHQFAIHLKMHCYQCKVCLLGSNRKDKLVRRHIQKVHPGFEDVKLARAAVIEHELTQELIDEMYANSRA